MENIVQHLVKFEGFDFTVEGVFELPDETTGFKGGFSWYSIYINDTDISWMLKENIIKHLIDIVVEENY